MARKIALAGVSEMQATLQAISDAGPKVAMASLRAGINVIARAMRKAAPVGETGQLRKSIGTRVGKSKNGLFSAKAGINVGKRTQRTVGRNAPHGHLVVLGTVERFRKKLGGTYGWVKPANVTAKQLSTGKMPANGFVKQAYQSARGQAAAAMQKQATKTLNKVVEQARK